MHVSWRETRRKKKFPQPCFTQPRASALSAGTWPPPFSYRRFSYRRSTQPTFLCWYHQILKKRRKRTTRSRKKSSNDRLPPRRHTVNPRFPVPPDSPHSRNHGSRPGKLHTSVAAAGTRRAGIQRQWCPAYGQYPTPGRLSPLLLLLRPPPRPLHSAPRYHTGGHSYACLYR